MYELVFWQYQEGIYLNHQLVYESLAEGNAVDGLENLQIDIILNRINNIFKDWEKIDDDSWKNPKGKGAFQIKTTLQAVFIDCYGTEGKIMDKLVAILEEYHAVLYDPQIPIRYDEWNE
ncbi:hypothetical protein [Flavobacterium branchiophilum]|uniref:Uncharacterized protein n=1 Tax=Flavobacterium branchiophilum TaxID=55197 RepID=A0A2H3KDV6_9FLAO|nr:hypothetical protein [Flavobacterium branchiophilum]PDS26239.1 hypothetical protein B0A77_02690 [Flavobacterium branchiophilum]